MRFSRDFIRSNRSGIWGATHLNQIISNSNGVNLPPNTIIRPDLRSIQTPKLINETFIRSIVEDSPAMIHEFYLNVSLSTPKKCARDLISNTTYTCNICEYLRDPNHLAMANLSNLQGLVCLTHNSRNIEIMVHSLIVCTMRVGDSSQILSLFILIQINLSMFLLSYYLLED